MKNFKKYLVLGVVLSLGGLSLSAAQEAESQKSKSKAKESAPKISESIAAAAAAAASQALEKEEEAKELEPKTEPSKKPKAEVKSEAKPDPEAEIIAAIRKEVSNLNLQRELYSARASHEKEKLAASQLERRIALDEMKFEMEERSQALADQDLRRKEKLAKELAGMKTEIDKLKAEKEVIAARADAELSVLKIADAKSKAELSNLMTEIGLKEKTKEARYYADREPQQLDNPLRGKRLVISDRRIELNGPIGASTADHISTRINFFNNKNPNKPIFIVIDSSPGGSVMSGYKILRAMEGSEAPIYVVVKQFAASMAATIATLADHSVAYPNAIILHHQLSSGVMGNLTQQRESLQEMEEWWHRLADPIAEKMGITSAEFIKRMYEDVSSGDWSEFGDNAQKLKWVDHIVDEIHETSLVKSPDARRPTTIKPTIIPVRRTMDVDSAIESAIPVQATGMELYEQIDQDGNPFVRLPRPNPLDHYYLYNPDDYYRFK